MKTRKHHQTNLTAGLLLAVFATLACNLVGAPAADAPAPGSESATPTGVPTDTPAPETVEPTLTLEGPEGTPPAEGDYDEDIDPFQPTDPPPLDTALDSLGGIDLVMDGEPVHYETGTLTLEDTSIDLASWNELPGLETLGDIYEVEITGIVLPEDAASGEALASQPTITISFAFSDIEEGREIQYGFPGSAEMGLGLEAAEIVLLSLDENGELVTFRLTSGDLIVTLISAVPGEPAAVAGTFSGTFNFVSFTSDGEEIDPERSVEVSDGVFRVEGIPYMDFEE